MAGLFDEVSGGLIVHWKTIAGITALVGTGNNARIWPHTAQVATLPYVTFNRVGGEPIIHLAGASGVRNSYVHVYAYATLPSSAETLANLLRTNTVSMRGTYSGVVVNRVQAFDITDGFEFAEGGTNQKRYWVLTLYHFVHGE